MSLAPNPVSLVALDDANAFITSSPHDDLFRLPSFGREPL